MRKLKLTEKKPNLKPQGNFRSHLTQLILDVWLCQKKEKMIDSQKLIMILLPIKRTVLEILTASAILIIIISL